ncbi:hypothetical protein EYC84_001862 [Monilinia fructicola]|uniref:Uncharacterized protein n=1 Tax=Monilinia fructicola TaxID=38448 RepID=A0A5M9JTY9_MONFR|nr:hypothetical protein EYC84_001862 [Monilinia fructicola]
MVDIMSTRRIRSAFSRSLNLQVQLAGSNPKISVDHRRTNTNKHKGINPKNVAKKWFQSTSYRAALENLCTIDGLYVQKNRSHNRGNEAGEDITWSRRIRRCMLKRYPEIAKITQSEGGYSAKEP